MAALYWRVKGQGKRAIDCLRQALNYAPHRMKVSGSTARRYSATFVKTTLIVRIFSSCRQDVPLISLANIFQNARLWEDALTVARMAVEIAPHFVVNHFTLANVYVTMVIQPFYSSFCSYSPFSWQQIVLVIHQIVFVSLVIRRSLKRRCAGMNQP